MHALLLTFALVSADRNPFAVERGYLVNPPPLPAPAPRPAAETKRDEPIRTPTPAAARVTLNGKGETVRVKASEADSARVVSPNCRCDGCGCEPCGCGLRQGAKADEPKTPPDPRRWYSLGGQYAGYYGYGTAQPDGTVLVSWHCRSGTTDVRRGLPVFAPAPTYFAPPATSCASGQCGASAYTYQRGYFGFRGR
jgi:hypothetical protein